MKCGVDYFRLKGVDCLGYDIARREAKQRPELPAVTAQQTVALLLLLPGLCDSDL